MTEELEETVVHPGPNRRVHTVFMTENTEYHVCADLCVVVRHRKTGVWSAMHNAVGMMLATPINGQPIVGRHLMFRSENAFVRTAKIVDIARPGRSTVASYQLAWCASDAVFAPESRPSEQPANQQDRSD